MWSLVTSPGDLGEILVTALCKCEAELHGAQNPVRGLWDRQGGRNVLRPIEVDGLSDNLKLYLERELVTSAPTSGSTHCGEAAMAQRLMSSRP
jgi:hypothetical protein